MIDDNPIIAITMPKWGLSMREGRVVEWLADEGSELGKGDQVLDVETDKIASAVEVSAPGTLRRHVAKPDEVLPVGALLGVIADADTAEADIDAFVQQFQEDFVPPEDDEDKAGPVYEWVETGGLRLRYLRLGNGGETVVLVHGFGGDLDNWLFNHQALAQGRTVYALDLPGHGQSAKQLTDGSIAGMAGVLRDFMDAVSISRAHLVGHSLGGAIALQTALSFPERVGSLALICSAGMGPDINMDYIEGFIAVTNRREAKPLLQQLFADPSLVTRQLVEDILKYKRLDGVAQALRSVADQAFAHGTQNPFAREALASLDIPVIVIAGSDDRVIPPDYVENLPGNVRAELLAGYGHMVQMEAAGEVNRLLEEHLA